MGNYKIKGLAKANECETHDAAGLADVWWYWFVCNANDQQCIEDFKRLRKSDQKEMLQFLRMHSFYCELYEHILHTVIYN